MHTTVSTRITIAAPPSTIFAFLTDLKNHYLWNPQTRQISQLGNLKHGSEFKTVSEVLNVKVTANNIVTKCSPPAELVIENEVGVVAYASRFLLDANNGGTAVKLSVTLSTHGNAWAFTLPVLRQFALRELRTDLQALKVAIENKIQG